MVIKHSKEELLRQLFKLKPTLLYSDEGFTSMLISFEDIEKKIWNKLVHSINES